MDTLVFRLMTKKEVNIATRCHIRSWHRCFTGFNMMLYYFKDFQKDDFLMSYGRMLMFYNQTCFCLIRTRNNLKFYIVLPLKEREGLREKKGGLYDSLQKLLENDKWQIKHLSKWLTWQYGNSHHCVSLFPLPSSVVLSVFTLVTQGCLLYLAKRVFLFFYCLHVLLCVL